MQEVRCADSGALQVPGVPVGHVRNVRAPPDPEGDSMTLPEPSNFDAILGLVAFAAAAYMWIRLYQQVKIRA